MASKGSVAYHTEYQTSADGAERIVKELYKSGGSLPDPSQNCYMILILSTYKNQNVQNTKNSGIAVVSYKSEVDTSKEVDPDDTREFDKYMIASGDNNALKVLKNLDEYPPHAIYSWAYRLRGDLTNYLNVGCKRDPRWPWNGAAVAPAPHYNIFSLIPLDPSLAP